MSNEDWLERRRHSIGGSDAGTILGLNEYSSPYALWTEKTGKITPEDISDKEAVRTGHDLEDYVAQRWMEKTGKKLRRDNNFVYNSDYPFAHVQADRLVVGENAGFEAKTTASWEILQQCRDGKYPDRWYCQCVHGMMVTGMERWYLGVLVLGKGFFEFTIERNEDEISALANAERSFWANVESNIPPALDGTEATNTALKTILGDSVPGPSIDLAGVGSHIAAYNALKSRIKDLEKELGEHQAVIMEYMGAAEKGKFGDSSVSFKTQERRTFDRDKFEAANGKIADMYFKISTSRPFKVTVKRS
jgi:putative phage-type endonuclease